MQQLSGLDATCLYPETANNPMHISGLAIYDPATAPGGNVRFKQILENTLSRSGRVPSMDSTLQTALRWDHPYWKFNDDFDPEFHIRHMALPQPGDWRQLCILVSRLHARPLDRNRPLWETCINSESDEVLERIEEKKLLAIVPPVPTSSVYSRADGVVSWELSVQLKGHEKSENIEVLGSHCAMALNATVWLLLADRLQQDDGEWRPFLAPRVGAGGSTRGVYR